MAENRNPSNGDVWKAKFWLLEVLGWFAAVVVIPVGVVSWILEAGDRTKERHYRAWELINSARGSTGDGGRRDALQDLVEDNVSLTAAPLADAYLVGVQLPGAILTKADMSRADLTDADLSGGRLMDAKLIKADLTTANLSGAKLWEADMSGAVLYGTNLTNTDLRGADLTSAMLSGTDVVPLDLTTTKFCRTTMPDGILNDRDCPQVPATPGSAPLSPSETPPAPK